MENSRFNPVFSALPTTIFTVMSALASEHGAINLGQGFPDEDGPAAIRERAARALIDGPNQYPPMRGLIELRRAIAAQTGKAYGLDYDPETEVVVTSGATEALSASIMGLVGAGGEVVLIEPAYDSYRPIAEAVGATVRTVTLAPPDWRLTEEALARVFTPATRAIVINSPLNPVGRVFDEAELGAIARMLDRFDAVAIADEVYEHLVYDGRSHVPLASLPGMRSRVVRVGSAGKMFSLTGWKVGWAMGDAALMRLVANAHQFLTFTTPPGLQLGVAHGLTRELSFAEAMRGALEEKRNLLAGGLAGLGFDVLPCEGTYFLTAGFGRLSNVPDREFCERMTREAGVAAIPLSIFFARGKPDHLVRFAFCKRREMIEDALARLSKHLPRSRKEAT
ncbi:MAG: aminotransferase [Alphaproteobacteria bacterium]|nr:aminotransferase [Alphaproteobacteria bacterium]